jgi:aminoglycoside 6'-N-acetyltransferase I
MIIRKLTNDDLVELVSLYVNVFNSEPWNDKWTEDTAFIRLIDIMNNAGFIGLAYEEKGEIVGAVLGNREQYFNGIHFFVKEMFVRVEDQKKGVGSKLLEELEKEAKKESVINIYLFTSKGNGTYDFYVKNNFKELKSMCMMGKGK